MSQVGAEGFAKTQYSKKKTHDSANGGVISAATEQNQQPIDADFCKVMHAWASLPTHILQSIAALVDASTPTK